jgi:hypothetical protein
MTGTTLKQFSLSVLSFLFLGFCSCAQASEVSSILTMTGTCSHLVIGKGRDVGNKCVGKVLNINYSDGRSGFYFVISDLAVITFSGMGNAQVKINADEVMQPIDTVIFGLDAAGTKPNSTHAVGTCHYTNPYKGKAFVNCDATTSAGAFSARFTTDGSPPQ